MRQATERQSGGVVTFIIVGFVMAALLAGGIYVSKQQGRTASRATATVAVNNTADTKSDQQPVDSKETQPAKDDTSTSTPRKDTSETAKPAAPTPTAQTPAQSTAPAAVSTPTPGQGAGSSVPATGPSHIATTGPSDIFVPAVGVSLLAAGALSYRRSRTLVRTRALER